jgi:transcriptional regulator with XRE-family HTH domain
MVDDVEAITRARLRAVRTGLGWSLDELAQRANLSASTISRVETGRRSIGLDVLVPMARALGIGIDDLLAPTDDRDVVIRPQPAARDGATVWQLSRPGASMVALKMRLEPSDREASPKVHAGHDWMFVLQGAVELTLGDRQFIVRAGEAAEFSTMTPHAVVAHRRPAEIIMVVDREGERSHLAHLVTDRQEAHG